MRHAERFIETERGCRGVGALCLMETGFQLRERKEFWRWMVVMAARECEGT